MLVRLQGCWWEARLKGTPGSSAGTQQCNQTQCYSPFFVSTFSPSLPSPVFISPISPPPACGSKGWRWGNNLVQRYMCVCKLPYPWKYFMLLKKISWNGFFKRKIIYFMWLVYSFLSPEVWLTSLSVYIFCKNLILPVRNGQDTIGEFGQLCYWLAQTILKRRWSHDREVFLICIQLKETETWMNKRTNKKTIDLTDI